MRFSRIDELLAASWKENGIKPAPPASDTEFLRRAWLDLCGIIPPINDSDGISGIHSFLDDPSPDKRERLVQGLLARPTHATLMGDLKERGLLESTTIIWLGEFGRTPTLTANRAGGGRDHYPRAWTSVIAGGGVKGGQAFGSTDEGGVEVSDGKVDVPDLMATLCQSLGIDPSVQNMSELGRPIRIAEGKPIKEILS
jgi:hypothetical protein